MLSNRAYLENWYIVVDCIKCAVPIPFAKAPTQDGSSEIARRTISNLKCPHCGHTDRYAPALMYRAQGPVVAGA